MTTFPQLSAQSACFADNPGDVYHDSMRRDFRISCYAVACDGALCGEMKKSAEWYFTEQ